MKCTISKLPIKTEKDIELGLGIKTEPKTPKQRVTAEKKNKLGLKIKTEPKSPKKSLPVETVQFDPSWLEEKRLLVEQIVTLKTENHEHLLALKQTQTEFTLTNKKLELQLANAGKIQKDNEKTIADLKRENQHLLARMKQQQNGLLQFNDSIKRKQLQSEEEDKEYEVEKILNHRNVVGRQYLIRWKGYDSDEDSWENEKNLNCAKLLNAYNRSNVLKK